MNQINKQIGQIIRQKREARNMTQLELSRLLGYQSTQFVSLFERGMSKVPLNVLGKLSVVLEIPESRLKRILLNEYKRKVDEGMRHG